MAAEAGRREQEAFRLSDRHHSAGIGGGIHLQFQGDIGVDPGQEGDQLGF